MVSAIPTGQAGDSVAVDYQVSGERTARAVARGDSRLVGVVLAGQGLPGPHVIDDVDAAIRAMGDRPRVYADAIFARTVEKNVGLPLAGSFDDVGVMLRLLDVAGLPATLNVPSQDQHAPVEVLRLFGELPACLRASGLDYVYAGVELPVVDSVVDMTINGMPVDVPTLDQVEAGTSACLDILRFQLADETGCGVRPDNDDDIRAFLYDRCGLPVPFHTAAGHRSVCDDALRQLVDLHPAVALVQSYRTQRHALTTCQNLRRHYCQRTGCVHGLLDPLGAATGRFSCRHPNLHGVPGVVRRAVRARSGMTLVEADISQAEYRVLAHFTHDPGLVAAFQAGDGDLHKQTMALALGKPVEAVTQDERKVGKAVNFGIVYGETEYGLSRQLGVSLAEAHSFIDGFFRGRPAVQDWIESVKQQVRRDGFVQTLSSRRRHLPAIWSSSPAAVAEAERQAVNTIIQGTAADLMKMMLARLHRCLPIDIRMLMTVHDSVLLEVPERKAVEASSIVRSAMESPLPGFTIPIRGDVHTGEDWALCK